jgi:hypothetical protein
MTGEIPLPEGMVEPKAAVTLKVANEGDKTIWVAESAEDVLFLVNNAKTSLITLTRVKGFMPSEFHTRFDNVANVEAIV